MSKRTCDNCGDSKDVKGGKTCDKGHFICRSCAYKISNWCPLCKTRLK